MTRKKEPTPTREEPERCSVCGGVGMICEKCDQPDGECVCEDGPEPVTCPECGEEDD